MQLDQQILIQLIVMKNQKKRPGNIIIQQLKQQSPTIKEGSNDIKTTPKSPLKDESQITRNRQIGSPSSPKKGIFLTQKKNSQIDIVKKQLENCIEKLNERIEVVIENHEAQFLIAYRNHNKRIREEMQEIKNKALSNANSSSSQTEKIETLQKQLMLFREESLRLFQHMTQKGHKIYNLESKIHDLTVQNQKLEQMVKDLMRKNKILSATFERSKRSQEQGSTEQFRISRPVWGYDHNLSFTNQEIQFRPNTTSVKPASLRHRNSLQVKTGLNRTSYTSGFYNDKQEKQGWLDNLSQNIIEKIQKILQQQKKIGDNEHEQFLQNLNHRLKNQIDILTQKFKSQKKIESCRMPSQTKKQTNKFHKNSFIQRPLSNNKISLTNGSKTFAKRSELELYFHKSIETVRKQITRRRGLKSNNFYNQYASLTIDQFKKVDFFRLLQLILSHDTLLQVLHNSLLGEPKKIYN